MDKTNHFFVLAAFACLLICSGIACSRSDSQPGTPAAPPPTDAISPTAEGLLPSSPIVVPTPIVPVVERQIGHGPLRVRTVEDDINAEFSLLMHVRVREGRDAARFDREYERRTRQIVEAVEQIMREATRAERQEASLSAIRERAQRAINDILGTPWVQQVIVSEVTIEVVASRPNVAEQ